MKKVRKGFTLVELLIVIAILGVLAAMMSTSAGSASAVAKASAINSNIRSIKAAALLYQAEQGEDFHEDDAKEENLKKFVDLQIYRKFSNKTDDSQDDIRYAIVPGTLESGTNVLYDGAYVVVSFKNDGDREAIATALGKYKNMRVTTSENDYIVGAFLYHVTPEDSKATDEPYEYNIDFKFPDKPASKN